MIALVVSSLTYLLEDKRPRLESRAIDIVVLGTVSGVFAGVLTIPLAMRVMEAFW